VAREGKVFSVERIRNREEAKANLVSRFVEFGAWSGLTERFGNQSGVAWFVKNSFTPPEYHSVQECEVTRASLSEGG
jgi:hypothetical protein